MKTTKKATDTARTYTHCLRSQQGVTLMETLVALGLFAITAASMGDFLVHQTRQSTSNYLDTRAYSLAADALEEARAGKLADLVEGSTTVDEGGVTFTTTTLVQNDTPAQGLKTITAQVSWNEPNGPRTVSVPTIYTDVLSNPYSSDSSSSDSSD